jgi:threonylcarbamoyladenosine tRNA methylthiotransferase MtaB
VTTFHVKTLGCKLNQFDSAAVEADLRSRGLPPSETLGSASVVVINTCTVTHRADADARRLFRRARRENPGCLLVATGCLAERDPGALEALPEVDLVVRRADRARIADLVAARADVPPPGRRTGPSEAPSCAGALSFGDRTRALLKIQDGCDLRCAYCVIPRVRGASQSVPPEAAEAQLRALCEAGYREVVLTGVNTGDYGRDLVPPTSLAALLRRLLRTPGLGRLRLNSLEPRAVTPDIVELLAGEPRLAPHLQVPLQSASDRVLRSMRRNYRASFYAGVLERLRSRVPDIGLGADVIVGHPGEGEAEFAETLGFVESSALNYLHVFSYSPRPGTESARHPRPVHPAAIRERSERLRKLGEELAARFRRSFLGRTLEVLAFRERRPDGRLEGLTGNFIEVGLDAGDGARNRLLPAVIERVDGDDVLASPAVALP